MDIVFLLWHTGPPDIDHEGMLIGVFRAEQDAKNAINALAGKPGFVDYSERFRSARTSWGKLHGTEAFAIPED